MLNLLAAVIFIAASMAVILSVVYWTLRNGISPMPTSGHARRGVLLLAKECKNEKIYELGSGWGTLLLPLAKEHPGSIIIGYETSPIPYFISWVRIKAAGLTNVRIIRKNFFEGDLSDAALVVCYLYPGAMERLKIKFEKELKKGASVISNTFAVPGWIPSETFKVQDFYHTIVYLYRR